MTIKDTLKAIHCTKYLGFRCVHNKGRGTPKKVVKIPGNDALLIYNLVKWMIYDMSEHERAEFLTELGAHRMAWPL